MIIGYTDKKGRLMFVAEGIRDGSWGTFCKKSGKWGDDGMHRVKSPLFPMRSSKESAQRDLELYARHHGWVPVEFTT